MTNPKRATRQERGYDWAWYNLRKRHLAQQPNCTRCGARGVDVDHITSIAKAPHLRLDPSNLRTLCHSCHSKVTAWNDKPSLERNPARGATETGLPLDPHHPWAENYTPGPRPEPWTKAAASKDHIPDELFWPTNLKPSAIPLTMVCGPPSSGKSTWVQRNAAPGDTVIELDEVFRSFGYQPRTTNTDELRHGLQERNRLLATLSTATHGAAWFVIGAATLDERQRWADMLKPIKVVVLAIQPATCIKRIMADPARGNTAPYQVAAVQRWWARFTHAPHETLICIPPPPMRR